MTFSAGTKLGVYEILCPIGSGGMGEVYRAADTKLGRKVALKILPQQFAADPDRMARFQREAQVLAQLNHPNIATIHGLEESESIHSLVMELVEGPTLADRIAEGPILLEEALPIAKQMAEALEYAHARGIMHRDLKPANVKLTNDGKVKVLDFGLAKAMSGDLATPELSNSPTMSLAATGAGVILGTAGYMAPEQAKGKVVDHPSVPPRIRELLRRCLMKNPRNRLQAIGDAHRDRGNNRATRSGSSNWLSDPTAGRTAVAVHGVRMGALYLRPPQYRPCCA